MVRDLGDWNDETAIDTTNNTADDTDNASASAIYVGIEDISNDNVTLMPIPSPLLTKANVKYVFGHAFEVHRVDGQPLTASKVKTIVKIDYIKRKDRRAKTKTAPPVQIRYITIEDHVFRMFHIFLCLLNA